MKEQPLQHQPEQPQSRRPHQPEPEPPQHRPQKITYKDAGVDIAAGASAVDGIKAAVRRTYTPEVIGDLGGFGGLFSAAAFKQMQDPILVSGTDGVGTKIELAERIGRFDSVGIDLVAMCANDIVTCGARPLFFLDYIATDKLEPARVASIVEGISEGCIQAGCSLIGGEMAEHPGLMSAGSFDLSGFCVGVVDRPKMIGPDKVEAGDVLIGLASSGLHSNGYSLVRRALTNALQDEALATAKMANGQPLAAALLEPTRIYVQPLLSALDAGLPIHAAAHITGGGITHNLDRALPAGLDAQVALDSWVIPPVIQEVADKTGLETDELLATFNMGIGMVLAVPANSVGSVMEHFRQYGAETTDMAGLSDAHGGVFEIGRVVKADLADKPGRVQYLGC
jgi:phosphoribosylformylglycinamidine cyclo-ligase